MEKKIVTRVTRTTTIEFTAEQIEELLRKECGLDSTARVDWDCSQDFVRSAGLTYTETESA